MCNTECAPAIACAPDPCVVQGRFCSQLAKKQLLFCLQRRPGTPPSGTGGHVSVTTGLAPCLPAPTPRALAHAAAHCWTKATLGRRPGECRWHARNQAPPPCLKKLSSAMHEPTTLAKKAQHSCCPLQCHQWRGVQQCCASSCTASCTTTSKMLAR